VKNSRFSAKITSLKLAINFSIVDEIIFPPVSQSITFSQPQSFRKQSVEYLPISTPSTVSAMVHIAFDNFTFCENVGIASLDVQALCWLSRVRTLEPAHCKQKSDLTVCSLAF